MEDTVPNNHDRDDVEENFTAGEMPQQQPRAKSCLSVVSSHYDRSGKVSYTLLWSSACFLLCLLFSYPFTLFSFTPHTGISR